MSLVNDETEERHQLQQEIAAYEQEIGEIRGRIFRYYELKRKSEMLEDTNIDSSVLHIDKQNHCLELLFYNQIIEVHSVDEFLTVKFPFEGSCLFSIDLKCSNNKWTLVNSHLPYTINLDDLNDEIKNLTLIQTVEVLQELQKNINAYFIREKQIKSLKKIMDSRIGVYHCLRYIDLELTFKLINTETKCRKVIKVQINFDVLTVQPHKVSCKIINGVDDDMQNFLKEKFKVFTKTDIIEAYNIAFTNNNKYKFFV